MLDFKDSDESLAILEGKIRRWNNSAGTLVGMCPHQVLVTTLTLSQGSTLYWCPHQVLKATGAPCNTLLSFLRNRRYSEKATKLMSKLRGIFLCFFWTSQKTSNSLYLIFFHLYDFKLNFQDPNIFKKLTKVDVL